MPINVTELMRSRTGGGKTRTLTLLATGDDDDLAIRAAVLASPLCPETYDGLYRQDVSIDEVLSADEITGTGEWVCRVTYGTREVVSSEQSVYTFDAGGATAHVTQSLQTIAAYAPSGMTAPDFKGAIGVTRDSVEGVDIPMAAFAWTEQHSLVLADEAGYKRTAAEIAGTVNDAPFKGFGAGEVLCRPIHGTKTGNGRWQLTFAFEASLSKSGLTIGDIEDVDKDGWDYLWVLYADGTDDAAKAYVKRPVAAYVERLFYRTDFSALGIGT